MTNTHCFAFPYINTALQSSLIKFPLDDVTVFPFNCVTMSPFNDVTLFPFNDVTMFPYNDVTMFPFNDVTLFFLARLVQTANRRRGGVLQRTCPL